MAFRGAWEIPERRFLSGSAESELTVTHNMTRQDKTRQDRTGQTDRQTETRKSATHMLVRMPLLTMVMAQVAELLISHYCFHRFENKRCPFVHKEKTRGAA